MAAGSWVYGLVMETIAPKRMFMSNRIRQTIALYTACNAVIGAIFSFWSASDGIGLAICVTLNVVAFLLGLLSFFGKLKGFFFLALVQVLQIVSFKADNHSLIFTNGLALLVYPPLEAGNGSQFGIAFQMAWSYCEVVTKSFGTDIGRLGVNLMPLLIITLLYLGRKKRELTSKKSFTPVLLVVGILAWQACNTGKAVPPKLLLASDAIDVGGVSIGDTVATAMTIYNTGGDTLRLIAVGSSCGCTVAQISDSTVAAGDSTIIRISVSVENEGPFKRQVVLQNNSDSQYISFPVFGRAIKTVP